MSLPLPSTAKRVDYIQSLRALAATLVAVSHIAKEEIQRGADDHSGVLAGLMSWQFGVDIFFVISGFIMYWVTFGKPKGVGAAAAFMKKRIVRVVPLYWLFTLLFVGPAIFVPRMLHHAGLSPAYLLASFTFVPWPKPGYGAVEPALGLGWTLNYEMMFYIIFSALLALRVNRVVGALAAIFVGIVVLGWFVPFEFTQVWYWSRSVVVEFLFGACIAAAVRRDRWKLPAWAGCAALLTGVVLWQVAFALWPVAEPTLNVRGFTWGVAATLIVGAVALTPALGRIFEFGGPKGLVQRVGDASYSLYLSHMFVVRIATLLLGAAAVWIYVPAATALCVVAALIVYRLLERPLLALSVKLSLNKAERSA